MDLSTTNASAPRRPEDIALDLLKFVASHANIKSGSTPNTPGFGVPSTPKGEDPVAQLLELYARCRRAVETPLSGK